MQPSLLFTDTLFEKLDYLVNTLGQRNFIMYVHPFVDAYLKRGFFFTIYRSWRRKLGHCFKIVADESLAYLQYRVLDANRNEIDLRAEKDVNASSAEKRRARTAEATDADAAEAAAETAPRPPAAPGEGQSRSAKARRRKRLRREAEAAAAADAPDAPAPDAPAS